MTRAGTSLDHISGPTAVELVLLKLAVELLLAPVLMQTGMR